VKEGPSGRTGLFVYIEEDLNAVVRRT
jgi:hypothetical protein